MALSPLQIECMSVRMAGIVRRLEKVQEWDLLFLGCLAKLRKRGHAGAGALKSHPILCVRATDPSASTVGIARSHHAYSSRHSHAIYCTHCSRNVCSCNNAPRATGQGGGEMTTLFGLLIIFQKGWLVTLCVCSFGCCSLIP